MTFTNSVELLAFHNVAYTIYAFIIISIIAWFGYNLTRKEKAKSVVRIPFYTYIAFLVAGGVGHHIFTYNTIPWVSEDITRHEIKPDATYHFEIAKHKWKLPQKQITIECGKRVMFDVVSHDLVYGFGLFRQDGSLVLQMQVNPGSKNDILWTFIADTLYQRFKQDLRRFEKYTAKSIFKKFIDMPGRVTYDGNKFQIKIRKRAYTPILKSVPKLEKAIKVPWLENKEIEIIWTA
jgi:cytochrome c oxidase subunit 2